MRNRKAGKRSLRPQQRSEVTVSAAPVSNRPAQLIAFEMVEPAIAISRRQLDRMQRDLRDNLSPNEIADALKSYHMIMGDGADG